MDYRSHVILRNLLSFYENLTKTDDEDINPLQKTYSIQDGEKIHRPSISASSAAPQNEKCLEKGRLVASGSHSDIYETECKNTCELTRTLPFKCDEKGNLVKVVSRSANSDYTKELLALKKLTQNAPYIQVALKGSTCNIDGLKDCLLLKNAGIELFEYILISTHQSEEYRPKNNTLKPLSIEQKIKIVAQMFEALEYMHNKMLVHRDIKPENILYDEKKEECYIIDFGFATDENIEKCTTMCGTLYYMCPHILHVHLKLTKSYNGILADHWSMAMTFFVMFFGNHPFAFYFIKNKVFKEKDEIEIIANPQKSYLRSVEYKKQTLYPELHEFEMIPTHMSLRNNAELVDMFREFWTEHLDSRKKINFSTLCVQILEMK